jgi:hypothetical protein
MPTTIRSSIRVKPNFLFIVSIIKQNWSKKKLDIFISNFLNLAPHVRRGKNYNSRLITLLLQLVKKN